MTTDTPAADALWHRGAFAYPAASGRVWVVPHEQRRAGLTSVQPQVGGRYLTAHGEVVRILRRNDGGLTRGIDGTTTAVRDTASTWTFVYRVETGRFAGVEGLCLADGGAALAPDGGRIASHLDLAREA